MTISYQNDVASSTAGGFTRLLFKWKGSLYKLICRELLLFIIVFTILGVIYRQVMTPRQKELFESVVKYFDAFLNLIPLSFVLGFYVSYVASRWWQQFLAIPWPDKSFHTIACYIPGWDEESRILRRSLLRWMNLALILVLRSISSAVKQRFPTLEHVVEAGFMTANEKKLFESVPANEFNTYWVPCTWFVFRLQEATIQGKLLNQYALENIMREFCEFRAKCGLLWCYDWVSIPMVYTQVVTLATYLFFIFTIVGRQKIDGYHGDKRMPSGRIVLDIDLYFPIYTVLQFFFYMGLLKVAEQLINPFGDDEEDFELNWLIDRHVKASFLGCDVLMNPDRIPPLVRDYYWDKQDCPIPYTEASIQFKKKTYRGSADDMKVPEDKCHMVLPDIGEEPEDGSTRLSLTSLLLESSNIVTNIGLGDDNQDLSQYHLNGQVGRDSIGDTSFYDRSPRYPRHASSHAPGHASLPRNGHGASQLAAAGPGSIRELYGSGGPGLRESMDSIVPSEDEADLERRGSLPSLPATPRTGPRDLMQLQERKRRNRRRDKHGFTWTPFIREEELPLPRPPQPAHQTPVKPHIRQNGKLSPSCHTSCHSDIITTTFTTPTSNILRTRRDDDDHQNMIDTPGSQRSDFSDNSYHTAISDLQDCSGGVIPKQVSESYDQKSSNQSVALERKSSVRQVLEQHYSIPESIQVASPPQKPNRTHTRKSDS